MCVIIKVENGNFPKLQTLKDAESLNSHGGSISWISNNKTNYEKGISAKKVHNMSKKLKKQGVKTALIHFRISSSGKINKANTHPFQISKESKTDLSLRDSNIPLLVHNGTANELFQEFFMHYNGKMFIPKGEFTDSRLMSLIVYYQGTNSLRKLVKGTWNKIAILEPKLDKIITIGKGWSKVDGHECSNNYFKPSEFKEFSSFEYNDSNTVKDWICYDSFDRQVFDKIKKLGMSDDEIETNYNMGYQLEDILMFADETKMVEKRQAQNDLLLDI